MTGKMSKTLDPSIRRETCKRPSKISRCLLLALSRHAVGNSVRLYCQQFPTSAGYLVKSPNEMRPTMWRTEPFAPAKTD